MVAARNLECHVGRGAGNALGIVAPFAVAWRFYFGVSSPAALRMRRPHPAALRMRRLHTRIVAACCGTPADALAPRDRFCGPQHSFSTLVNLASPFLNGLVQFVGPALLFAAYARLDTTGAAGTPTSASAAEAAAERARDEWDGKGNDAADAGRSRVRVMGITAPVETWRGYAVALATGTAALIGATYALNATIGASVIRAGIKHGDYVSAAAG